MSYLLHTLVLASLLALPASGGDDAVAATTQQGGRDSFVPGLKMEMISIFEDAHALHSRLEDLVQQQVFRMQLTQDESSRRACC